MDNISASLSDVLYPECHLNSPIVTGKLIYYLFLADLPLTDNLNDKTLLNKLIQSRKTSTFSQAYRSQQELKAEIMKYYPSFKKFNPIPYPYGNRTLFNMYDLKVASELTNYLSYGSKCYLKIVDRLLKLRSNVIEKLGSSSILLEDGFRYNSKKIKLLAQTFENSKWYRPFTFWFTIKTNMRRILKISNRRTTLAKNKIWIMTTNKLFIIINRNLCLIIIKSNMDVYYLTFEHVLMFSDVVEGRLMIDLGMSSDFRLRELHSKGHKLWELIDALFIDCGNLTYNIVALIEPLVLGFLQLNDESSILRGAFLKFCLNELQQELTQLGFVDKFDLDFIMDSIFDIFSLSNIHLLAEFYSFFRTFGHPTLEAKHAADKVREHMNKPKIIGFQTMMKGHALFCGTIINGYRERHSGSWPPLVLPLHASSKIINARNNDESLTDEICIENWKSFVGLTFKCFMPLVLDDDLTMYMKDKALAAVYSEWDSMYPPDILGYSSPPQSVSRRLVEVFLEDSQFDPINLVNYILSGEYLKDPEFNLSYSLKEKEIKQVGRLFAKMTYKMRACQVLAESLIATGIGKYFKENGIVKDEHDLLKTLHKLSVSSVPKDTKVGVEPDKTINKEYIYYKRKQYDFVEQNVKYETISTFLTTDLQKFCLNWRQETTNIFAERLNEIYGLPGFFNWLHKRLERSVLYVADPHCPPESDNRKFPHDYNNEHIFIKYPMGGIEGFCQKLWTIITIPFLFLSAYEVGAKIAAVVQGDNQAIAITRRVHPNIPYNTKKNMCVRLTQQYFDRLRQNLYAIGHNLKAHETIVSSHFFVYSKRIYYDGLALSQSLKPLSRAVFWSETIVDETRSACSNISTAISKSIEQGFDRWIGYAINILRTIQQIIISLKFTLNESMTEDVVVPVYSNPNWILSAALIPSQIGGFNYMNISRLYVRNIGDPVTASLADIKRFIEARIISPNLLSKIMNQQPGDSHFLDWTSDPYSINLPDSQSVTILLKNITARNVLSGSPNPMLAGLFHIDFEQEDRDLAAFLLDRQIIMPRAAHEIMDQSLTGARQEIAGMLDTTKGLIRNGLRMGGLRPRLVDRISLYDYNQFKVFNLLMTNNNAINPELYKACSVQLAIALRKRMWFHLTHGRPIYGLEVPDIIESMNGFTIKGCESCYYCEYVNKQFCWFLVPRQCELDNVLKESNMMRIPYFGSTTDERSQIKLSNIKSASRALRSAVRIATVYTWAFGDTDQNWEEAWYLASFRANLTLNELKAITPISTSNNIAHRLRDRSTQMKYSGTTINRVGRYIVISNDNLNIYIDNTKTDSNLIYQQVMLLGVAILEDQYRYSTTTGDSNRVFHLHIENNCCVIPMADSPYVETLNPLPTLQMISNNRLIYDEDPISEHDHIIVEQQLYKQGTLMFPQWSLRNLEILLSQSLSHTIIDIITKENKDHLTEFKVLDNDDDINSLITEFLLVHPEEFSLHLGLTLAISWAYNIYYRRPEGKYQILEMLNTILNTTSRAYFTVLLNAFSHQKVFNRFWDCGLVEPIYGPNLLNQDYFRIIIDFLILSLKTYLDYWLDENTLDYLVTESQEDIIDQKYESIQARHLCILNCLYSGRQHMPKIRGLTSIEKCFVLTENLKEMNKMSLTASSWNLDSLDVIIYPASITYLRRGSVKHIKLRKLIVDPLSIPIGQCWNPMNTKDHIIFRPLQPHYGTRLRTIPYNLLFSSDLKTFLDIDEDIHNGNNWESHVSRRVGINSTSCYKAVEIGLEIIGIIERELPRLFIGEGSGAMMMVYYMLLGPTKVYYNSGIFDRMYLGQRVLDIHPSEVSLVQRNNPQDLRIRDNLHILFNGRPESTWIGNMECYQHIINNIEDHSLGLIHSDIENTHLKDQNITLIEQCHIISLAINLGGLNTLLILKIAPQNHDFSPILLRGLTEWFKEIQILIPYSSNPYSSEVYVLCKFLKKITFKTPDDIYDHISIQYVNSSLELNNNIINIKVADHIRFKFDDGMLGSYNNTVLANLTDIERTLLSYGFQLNGPKIIKQLTHHDIGSGINVLENAIKSLFHSIMINLIEERDDDEFFSPYPLKKDSKINLELRDLANKIAVYVLLAQKEINFTLRKRIITELRSKRLLFNLLHYDIQKLIDRRKLKKCPNIRQLAHNSYQLSTKEVKLWWKIVGYSLLYNDN
nr:RNA-dependent RNA polymerase [Paramyxoviridae sp.]